MNHKKFNEKYKLKVDLNAFKFSTNSNSVGLLQLVGKPKKNIFEITKRFFTNTYSVIALVVFLVVLMMAIIIPFTSPYLGDVPITNQNAIFNGGLPSSSEPIKTQIFTNSQRQLFQDIQTQLGDGKTFIISENLLGFNQWEITYNAYDLLSFTNNGQTFNSILGTTSNGFDIWTRSWAATIQSLALAVLVAIINTLIGVSLGIYLGFNFGKPIDTFFERVLEIINSLPNLIWILILVSVIGTEFWQLVFVLVLIGWSGPVSEARRFAIIIKDSDFIIAAEAIGASKKRRIFVHLLPHVIGRLAISFVQRIPSIIFLVSSLSFLGFLTNPANLNLGNVLVQSLGEFSNNPWTLLLPSIILLVLTLSLQFIALGVHDAIDPQLRKV